MEQESRVQIEALRLVLYFSVLHIQVSAWGHMRNYDICGAFYL